MKERAIGRAERGKEGRKRNSGLREIEKYGERILNINIHSEVLIESPPEQVFTSADPCTESV